MRNRGLEKRDWESRIERLPPAVRSPLHRSLARARRMRLRAVLWFRAIGPLVRRALDIVASLTALILLVPVFVIAAIAIKVTSRGPVLFRQERVGRWGRRFQMLKLRTMVTDAEAKKQAL